MFEFKTLKSEKQRYTIACKAEGCPLLHLSKTHLSFASEVSSISTPVVHLGHTQATLSFLTEKITEKLKDQLLYRPTDIKKISNENSASKSHIRKLSNREKKQPHKSTVLMKTRTV